MTLKQCIIIGLCSALLYNAGKFGYRYIVGYYNTNENNSITQSSNSVDEYIASFFTNENEEEISKFLTKANLEKSIGKHVKDMSGKMLDNETKYLSTEFDDRLIVVSYQMVNYDYKILKEIDIMNIVYDMSIELVCGNDDIHKLMNAGLVYNYIVYDKNKKLVGKLVVTKEDCKNFKGQNKQRVNIVYY
jgi:hypothetical protein